MSKRIVITIIALGTAALHFITGGQYGGPFFVFVNSYLIDILLPMTLILLMGLFQNKILRSSLFRAGAVFTIGCLVEASQYLGYPIFGSTFDPFDILAYAGGVLIGIGLDLVIFPKIFQNWMEER
jgi:hypothetical protein